MAILTIRTEKIVRNFTLLKSLCDARGLELVTVVKCCLGEDGILRKLVERGAHIIAETSPANLARFEGDVKRMLLRSSLSDIRSGLPNCDYVLVSELPLLHALSELPASRRPAAILTLEFGDLREGIPPDQLPEFLHDATRIKGARIVGFAATFGCLLGKLPDADTIARLRQLMNRLA
jgi:predicted amino acid racemase